MINLLRLSVGISINILFIYSLYIKKRSSSYSLIIWKNLTVTYFIRKTENISSGCGQPILRVISAYHQQSVILISSISLILPPPFFSFSLFSLRAFYICPQREREKENTSIATYVYANRHSERERVVSNLNKYWE